MHGSYSLETVQVLVVVDPLLLFFGSSRYSRETLGFTMTMKNGSMHQKGKIKKWL